MMGRLLILFMDIPITTLFPIPIPIPILSLLPDSDPYPDRIADQ